jgi:hypothetical protein
MSLEGFDPSYNDIYCDDSDYPIRKKRKCYKPESEDIDQSSTEQTH